MNNQNKKEDKSERNVMIFIAVVIALFVFGLKPMYKFVEKLKSGELFKKAPTPIVQPTPEPEIEYQIMAPVGDRKVVCTKSIVEGSGTRKATIKLYFSSEDDSLKSIEEEKIFSGVTEEYSNYIMLSQSKYKQRKNNNTNDGYSVEITLDGTNYLKLRSVYLLDKIELSKLILSEDDSLDVVGELNENIAQVISEYSELGYGCEG